MLDTIIIWLLVVVSRAAFVGIIMLVERAKWKMISRHNLANARILEDNLCEDFS